MQKMMMMQPKEGQSQEDFIKEMSEKFGSGNVRVINLDTGGDGSGKPVNALSDLDDDAKAKIAKEMSKMGLNAADFFGETQDAPPEEESKKLSFFQKLQDLILN